MEKYVKAPYVATIWRGACDGVCGSVCDGDADFGVLAATRVVILALYQNIEVDCLPLQLL